MSTEAKSPKPPIVRTFDAARELVWRAWTEDTELAQWLRPFGVTTDSVSFDVRVGGVYTYTMTNDETDEKFPTGGQFLEVEPMDRLVFTWGEPAAPVDMAPVITLSINGKGGRPVLTFHLRGYDGTQIGRATCRERVTMTTQTT